MPRPAPIHFTHTKTKNMKKTTLTQENGLWVAEADVPQGTTACFLNLKAGPLTASSDYFEIK
jgi:hypothetical protein